MYIYGKNVAREKISSGDKIRKAYISDNFKDKDIINRLRDNKVKINFVNNREFLYIII